MKSIVIAVFTLAVVSVFGYHDPDLNYHINQVQKLQGCDEGYSYPAPAVQLSTSGVKVAAPTVFAQPAPTYRYSDAGYSAGVVYQAPLSVPQNTYLPQQSATYQATSLASQSNYAATTATKEVHGYATSAGLSSVAAPQRTVIPQATYAQAPIIAKITAAPLIARFSSAPAKTTFVSQNFMAQATGSARASLNSYGAVHTGGPVVSQVFAAPSATYATAAALKSQTPQVFTPTQYQTYRQPTSAQYNQAGQTQSSAVSQYATSSVSQAASASSAASGSSYFSPAQQYSAPTFTQYTAPAISQYRAPVQAIPLSQVFQYSAPAVTQYTAPTATHYSQSHYAGASVAQYKTANVRVTQHAAAPVLTHVQAPAVSAPIAHIGAPLASIKNVHTDFLENYDAHPRYAYEYSVNDPHTGDIKQQKEERDGEVVKGQYSLVEPDGSVRTVNYVADWETGFHADVRNSKDSQH